MKENEYFDAIREVAFYFLVAPAIILLGMFTIGTILDSFLDTTGTFAKLFLFIGGIPGISMYYYRHWRELNKSKLNIK
jgi:hypothetical protein